MQKIAVLNDFSDDGTLILKVDDRQIVLTCRNNLVRAFVNSCPHMGVPLDASGEKITTFDDTLLICTMHGAMFEFDSGVCVGGPCAGRSLQKVDIVVENETIFLK
jgi:nitrite reductase/ring-hydroxylating ferredoxin subunit